MRRTELGQISLIKMLLRLRLQLHRNTGDNYSRAVISLQTPGRTTAGKSVLQRTVDQGLDPVALADLWHCSSVVENDQNR